MAAENVAAENVATHHPTGKPAATDPFGAEAVRALMAEVSPVAEVRRLMETDAGYDPDVWSQLAGVGLLAPHLPERFGGAGRSWSELATVLEGTGAALLCAPYLSTVAVAASTIAAAAQADEADVEIAAQILPDIAAGRSVVAVAVAEDDGRWDEASITTRATPEGASWRLDGHKSFVVDGAVADLLLVAARTAAGTGVFLVSADASGLDRSALNPVDQTRRQARITFSSVAARRLGGGRLTTLLDLASVALACEAVGGARRCLEMAVDHARQRVQFGQPIGTFQAVAHRCADMLVDLECARAGTDRAARAVARGDPELTTLAPLAKVAATEAFAAAAAANIQLHGGTGFTWACDAHLYFKRARASQLLFGHPRLHREELARRLGW